MGTILFDAELRILPGWRHRPGIDLDTNPGEVGVRDEWRSDFLQILKTMVFAELHRIKSVCRFRAACFRDGSRPFGSNNGAYAINLRICSTQQSWIK